MNPHDYSITVRRILAEEGPCFEARVRELPDVAEYADTYQEAYELAVDTIETTAELMRERGRTMPGPAPSTDDYSGRITVRVTRHLHRELALAAEEEGVSLNLLIATALAAHAGARKNAPVTQLAEWQGAINGPVAASRPKKTHLRLVRDLKVDSPSSWARTA